MAENYAVFTPEERARIRYHMGYLQAGAVASIALGVPAATQPMFLVEGAMDRIPISAVGLIRDIVARMDRVECQIAEAGELAPVKNLGEMELTPDYLERLEALYVHWARKLEDTLGAPLNPYSARFGGGKQPVNVRVVSC